MSPSFEAQGVRWWLADRVDPGPLQAALPRLVEALERGAFENRKRGRRKELYRVRLDRPDGSEAILKVNRYRVRTGFRRALFGSKARRELRLADRVAARGIRTPVPLAAGERRVRGRLTACYLVVPLLPGAVDLRRLWAEPTLPARERRALAREFGRFSRAVCDAGIFQDDFAPNNFLAERGDPPRLFMIDFERAHLRRTGRRARCFVLAKIAREMPDTSATQRLRFLHAYSGGDREEARAWWRAVAAYAPRLALRDLARLQRTATRAGRRFRPLADGGWSGFAHRDASHELLEQARRGASGSWDGVRVERMEGLWRVVLRAGRKRHARRLWAQARLLYARGLGAEPLGLWWRGGLAVLALARAPGERPLSEAGPRDEVAAALRVLLCRTLALGQLAAEPAPELFAAGPDAGGRIRVRLLRPDLVRLKGRPDPSPRARSAVLCERLLPKRSERVSL